MGLVSTLADALKASTQTTNRGEGTEQSAGAYWCHDCGERLLDTDAETDDPACPECGDPMEFERSPGSTGCAC